MKFVRTKKMLASEGVNWHLGCSSCNSETVKNDKRALEAYFHLDFLVRFASKQNEHNTNWKFDNR